MTAFARWVGPGTRVALVSGSFGAGHDAAAREVRTELLALGASVTDHDVVEHFPLGLGRLLRTLYFLQLRLLPGTWGGLLDHLGPDTLLHRLTERLLGTATPSLLRLAAGCDLVVATHPFVGQALGPARADGRLAVPVVTYLTDPSVHPLWVHPAVDLHLAPYEVAATQARAWGGRALVERPVPPASCADAAHSDRTGLQLRFQAELAFDGPFALITGGSEGIGDLVRAAADVLATGHLTPVVVCGNNGRLQRRLARRPGVVALGWRDDVPELMRAASVVVQNAGGFTCRESLAVGTPLVSYRCLPGHGRANAAALQAEGIAGWALDIEQLHLQLAAVTLAQPAAA